MIALSIIYYNHTLQMQMFSFAQYDLLTFLNAKQWQTNDDIAPPAVGFGLHYSIIYDALFYEIA